MTIVQCRVMETAAVGTPPMYNIFHCNVPDDPTVTEVEKLVTPFVTFYTTVMGSFAEGTVASIFDRVVTVEPTPRIVTPPLQVVTPPTVHDPTAPQLCAVVSWATPLAGPRYRGRTYLGPLSTNALSTNSGQLSTTYASAVAAAAQQLMADIVGLGEGYNIGVLSRATATPTLTYYSGVTVHAQVRTQRRRN